MVRHAAELVKRGYQSSPDSIRRDNIYIPGSVRYFSGSFRGAMLRKKNPEIDLRGKPHNGGVGRQFAHLFCAIKDHEDASDWPAGLRQGELIGAGFREGFRPAWAPL
jgi:hypothetical protein